MFFSFSRIQSFTGKWNANGMVVISQRGKWNGGKKYFSTFGVFLIWCCSLSSYIPCHIGKRRRKKKEKVRKYLNATKVLRKCRINRASIFHCSIEEDTLPPRSSSVTVSIIGKFRWIIILRYLFGVDQRVKSNFPNGNFDWKIHDGEITVPDVFGSIIFLIFGNWKRQLASTESK